MNNIDRKFNITAVNPCKPDRIYTEKDGVFFCAKDSAFPAALEAYLSECVRTGCEQAHIDSIELLLERVITYQRSIEMKLPDTDTDCEIDRCIGGISLGGDWSAWDENPQDTLNWKIIDEITPGVLKQGGVSGGEAKRLADTLIDLVKDYLPVGVVREDKYQAMEEAMTEFVERCDAGEVRSKHTYSKFKQILGMKQ